MSVLAAIAVLALLIVVHEAGHFLAARWQGIYANRFSIGFGPVLLRYQGKETEYALRAFPLGGYVGFPDDDPDSTIDPRDPNLLRNRPVLDRAIVISAGVIANLIFAFVILVTQVSIVGIPQSLQPQPGIIVPHVMGEKTPAAIAGLQAGDIITAQAGQTLGSGEQTVKSFIQTIKTSAGQTIPITVQRNGSNLQLSLTPETGADGQGRIGVQLAPNGQINYRRPKGPGEVLRLASQQFEEIFRRTVQGFGQLVTNFQETAGQVSGPVKIVEWGANIAASDSGNLFFFAALISVNLAVINILPLPALDGGQLFFLAIEALQGRPLPRKLQEGVMQTGLMLLLGLGIVLIVRDTTQLAWVQQFLQQ
ncbi:RIP metalloprotease RseP [Synechococcus elongatus]|uniref:Zinc metalloprotease n=2 Tax=Synechococcus elongatus TaxID=32046 RepID=Q31R39_SYNE7|nr:RIP metalloprotease RseP [Synechococcus elongatus]ABB56480.1 YUP8H12.25 {{Arabidopsis thaliana}}-type protein. Metallo peptidase. MEROPS family M50B [Synechococcus elongatus PCC 7942 = FACHB-805]AJD56476.1 zinc metalloprotease [Synechococcus elongatus UTEX 2973]MBD2588938.1 RIP metalloprotease RseP [Synechococcus elongatus FACHB-242]MBD2690004.1 RIP metalloprotease RseP [Synechococcus elongatus FACHB-1061]MBD2706975.1 RIP metalloprotease RseP [Synechococcus elongatus PCC 7942 = FACHB-805]